MRDPSSGRNEPGSLSSLVLSTSCLGVLSLAWLLVPLSLRFSQLGGATGPPGSLIRPVMRSPGGGRGGGASGIWRMCLSDGGNVGLVPALRTSEDARAF